MFLFRVIVALDCLAAKGGNNAEVPAIVATGQGGRPCTSAWILWPQVVVLDLLARAPFATLQLLTTSGVRSSTFLS